METSGWTLPHFLLSVTVKRSLPCCQIADAVHERGSYLYMQIWALGRAAIPAVLKAENPDYPYVSASAIPLSSRPEDVPRALTIPGEHTGLFCSQ